MASEMTHRWGVTLVEFLIVIALIGILIAIAVAGSQGLIARTAVQEGAQTFARTIDRARTESKRVGAPLRVVVDATSRQVRIVDGANAVVWAQTLPPGTEFAGNVGAWGLGTTPVRFLPPHAALATPIAGTEALSIAWSSDSTILRTVYVTGVFGKVAVQ